MIGRVLKAWILTSFIIFVAVAASYLGAQQVLRQSANDPQIEIARDEANLWEHGSPGKSNVSPENSLGTFVILYNEKGEVLSSNANLDPKDYNLPPGLLEKVKNSGESKFTWQPSSGRRFAAVMEAFKAVNGGTAYILAARNLDVVEGRIQTLTLQYVIGFMGAIVLDFVLILGLEVVFKEKRGKN